MSGTYRAVFDIDWLDSKGGLFRFGKKKILKDEFVHYYNHFCDITNPRIPEFNDMWKEVESTTSKTYEEFMREKFQQEVDSDRTFRAIVAIGTMQFEIDEQCQFVVTDLYHGARIKLHLEEM